MQTNPQTTRNITRSMPTLTRNLIAHYFSQVYKRILYKPKRMYYAKACFTELTKTLPKRKTKMIEKILDGILVAACGVFGVYIFVLFIVANQL